MEFCVNHRHIHSYGPGRQRILPGHSLFKNNLCFSDTYVRDFVVMDSSRFSFNPLGLVSAEARKVLNNIFKS